MNEFKMADNSANFYADVSGKFRKRISEACRLVKKDAKVRCPKDTGALRRSIKMRAKKTYGKVYSDLFYSRFVEFGTDANPAKGHHATKPYSFLRAALEANKKEIANILTRPL